MLLLCCGVFNLLGFFWILVFVVIVVILRGAYVGRGAGEDLGGIRGEKDYHQNT